MLVESGVDGGTPYRGVLLRQVCLDIVHTLRRGYDARHMHVLRARCLPNMGKHLAPVGQILRQAVAQNVMMTDRAFEIKRPALPEEERQG